MKPKVYNPDPILRDMDHIFTEGVPDYTTDGGAMLIRPTKVNDERRDVMVWTDGETALLIFFDLSKKPVHSRRVLLDGGGKFGKIGQVYVELKNKPEDPLRAIPGVKKYIQPVADIMNQRVHKLRVARDYSEGPRVTDRFQR